MNDVDAVEVKRCMNRKMISGFDEVSGVELELYFMNTVLPTFLVCSATDLKANPELAMATQMDWRKVPRFLEGSWPEPYPNVHLLGDDAKADIFWWKIAFKAKYCVVDVETEQLPDGSFTGRIIQIGLYPRPQGRPGIWDRVVFPEYEQVFIEMYKKLVAL